MKETNVLITSIGRYIPEKTVKNDFSVEHFRKEEWGNKEVSGLLNHLGREERHFCERGESSLSMAIEAAKTVLEKSKTPAEDIDMIIFASDTPEYTVPTNALFINKALGTTNANAIFDINNNCTSMVVALDNATHFMKAHKDVKKAIVVGSFHASAMVRFDDTVTYPNFGDASTALLLEKTEDEETRGYIDSRYKSDSSYADCVKFPACGHAEALLGKQHKYYRRLEWNPFDSSFFSDVFAEAITSLMKEHNVTDDDIAFYAFNQLSNAQNQKTLTKIGAKIDERYLYNGDKFGYTGANSPFLALSDVWNNIEEHKGKYAIIISIGAGYSMAAVLYRI